MVNQLDFRDLKMKNILATRPMKMEIKLKLVQGKFLRKFMKFQISKTIN